ncbi:13524_t:CDS:2, partial [Cetraspora pellucida]
DFDQIKNIQLSTTHTSSKKKRKNASLICHERRNIQGIVRALRADFPELHIKEYHDKLDPIKKTQDFRDVDNAWKNIDLIAYTSMIVLVIELTPKPEDNTILLTKTVKEYSSVIKAEEISDLANANIINRKIAEHLENKPKKTLEEMQALDQHYIVNYYNIAPKSLTEEFISEFGNYNHMRWFKALQKL